MKIYSVRGSNDYEEGITEYSYHTNKDSAYKELERLAESEYRKYSKTISPAGTIYYMRGYDIMYVCDIEVIDD